MSYQSEDLERFLEEPAKRAGRSEFARDRARVIHSFALRRLAAKTQVAVPWADDFPRTRLSHSLECAQVGREIGGNLGADPDLIDTACLAHDLGHPPFGHNGEVVLAQLAENIGGFEGNAQSFRILTRLEAKTMKQDRDRARSIGLNLTRACLDAATKYPWRKDGEITKFGVYDSDWEIFKWMRGDQRIKQGATSLEAEIMDWSDDIAYSVHDLEDGVVTNKISLSAIEKNLDQLFHQVKENYIADLKEEDFLAASKNLIELALWPKNYDGSHYALSQLKNLTSQLIGRFAKGAEDLTRAKYGAGPLSRYNANLEVPYMARVEVAFLKSISSYFIIGSDTSQERYLEQRELLKELVERIFLSAPEVLEPFFILEWREATTDEARLRVVIDQVASFTDLGAIKAARKLGIRSLAEEN